MKKGHRRTPLTVNANMEDDIFWMIIHGQEITPRRNYPNDGKEIMKKKARAANARIARRSEVYEGD